MQYSVPQFIDVEDTIIGPLTLKQFLVLLAGGLVIFSLWKIFNSSPVFFLLLLPTVLVIAGLAFGKFNGRSFLTSAVDLVRFFVTPKRRIFMHEDVEFSILKKQQGAEDSQAGPTRDGEKVSRLKRLAYLLDQKTAEEERLIHSGKLGEQWLNKI